MNNWAQRPEKNDFPARKFLFVSPVGPEAVVRGSPPGGQLRWPGWEPRVSPVWQHSAMTQLPNGVSAIVEYVARMAEGYSSGLKWNEEHKLKADMMNMPARWVAIEPDVLRQACVEAGMSAADASTVSGFLRTRKQGGRFSVRSGYKSFHFLPVVTGTEGSAESRGIREW